MTAAEDRRFATSAPDCVAAAAVWSSELLQYRHSADHPMSPKRLELTMALASELAVFDGVELINPVPATAEELYRVHSERYVTAVIEAGQLPPGEHPGLDHGLGTADNPTFLDMHDASAAIAGSTLTAARAIADGSVKRAVSIAGGMHHAMESAAAGFCVYNDAALAISWLLDNGYSRVAYVDIDVHHGDGVQSMYYDDPRVLTVSIHQHPATLWPSTGWSSENGAGKAEGRAVNLPCLPGTNDSLWLRGFGAIVPSVLRAFEPEILVTQCGVDSHREDPLADLSLTVDGHRRSYRLLRQLADELCEGRWLAMGGGGYELIRVVPRSWTHLIATVLGRDIPVATALPPAWLDLAGGLTSPSRLPTTMGDGEQIFVTQWDGSGHGELEEEHAHAVGRMDQAIIDTRRAVLPSFGLDPDDPRD